MLALFIAASSALALVVWAELRTQSTLPSQNPSRPVAPAPEAVCAMSAVTACDPTPPATTEEADAAILARLAQLLAEPAPLAPIAAAQPAPAPVVAEDLPRVAGFRPGDVLELEIEGPLPRPEDLRFEQVGRDARLLLEGLPALIFEGVPARHLRPSHIRFRGPQAA